MLVINHYDELKRLKSVEYRTDLETIGQIHSHGYSYRGHRYSLQKSGDTMAFGQDQYTELEELIKNHKYIQLKKV